MKLPDLLQVQRTGLQVAVREFAVPSAQGVRRLVVHQAKGQTFEGVLLSLSGAKKTPSDLTQWLDKFESGETRLHSVLSVSLRRPETGPYFSGK